MTQPTDEQARKKARVEQACDRCRSRKVRCDGAQPICGNCSKRNQHCVYNPRLRSRYSAQYIQELERKAAFASANGVIPQPSQAKESPPPQGDAMGSTGGDGSEKFYGSSSAASFAQLVQAAANVGRIESDSGPDLDSTEADNVFRKGSTNGSVVSTGSGIYQMSRPGHSSASGEWVFPPRKTADSYVDSYFAYSYSLYPFVHKPTFMRAYESIWTGEGYEEDDDLFYCIVNLVFALGALLGPHPDPFVNSKAFYDRSRQFLRYDIFEPGSILLLQALLLSGQYLQASQNPAACWNVFGLAIRVAQEVGLHRDRYILSRSNIIEQQLCRRLWYGCLILERITSTTFGRPLMVPQKFDVDPPCCVDDEYIGDSSIASPPLSAPPSVIHVFVQTSKLYDILAEILTSLYDNVPVSGASSPSQSSTIPRDKLLQHIIRLEIKLCQFEKEIPPHLRVENIANSPYPRQTNVLFARFLHVRILLYRPSLLPASSTNTPGVHSELLNSVEFSASKLCLDAACSLIELIVDNQHTPNIPAMWYNIFYVHTSATVLLAAKLHQALQGQLDTERMAVAWKGALNFLRKVQPEWPGASRCLKVLEFLHDKISNTTSHEKPTFDLLPRQIDPGIELPSDLDGLIDLMNDRSGPLIESASEYLQRWDIL